MKIYERVVIDMKTGAVLEEDSFEYTGPVAEAKGGGGGSTTTVQKADPWAGQQGYLTDVFSKAQQQYNTQRPEYYPGPTVVPYSAETNAALNMQTQRALAGSPITQAAQNQLVDTMAGNYLGSNPGMAALRGAASGDYVGANPYIDSVVDRALGKTRSAVDSQFAAGGRYGSGLHKIGMTEAMGDTAANLYGANYAQERANQLQAANQLGTLYDAERQKQMQAMLFAPQMAEQDYVDAQHLAAVGGAREQLSQEQLADQVARWNFNQNRDADALARYNALIQGNYGGTSSTTSPYYQNRTGGILGGALGGAQIGGMIGGPFGAGVGAIGGGLLGLF